MEKINSTMVFSLFLCINIFIAFQLIAEPDTEQEDDPWYYQPDPESVEQEKQETFARQLTPSLVASVLFTNPRDGVTDEGSIHGGIHARLIINQALFYNMKERNAPAFLELYLETGLYKGWENNDWGPAWFQYLLGFNLSFETMLQRRFLVPFFGGRWGGLYVDGQGHGVFVEPLLGLLLVPGENLRLGYEAGLFMNAVDLEGLMGIRQALSLGFSF